MDIAAIAKELGIKLRHHHPGNQYTTCPSCSHKRKGAHKNLKCLSVKIDDKGIVWNCHNCFDTGARNAERKPFAGDRKQGIRSGTSDKYGAVQRKALRRWVRRT